MYTLDDVNYISEKYKLKFDKFSKDDLLTGLNIEKEHGLKNPVTNITDDDLENTAKIALAHLNEFSNYYNKEYGLPYFEKSLKEKHN